MYVQLLKSGVTPSKELTSKILNSLVVDNRVSPSPGFRKFFEAIREHGNIEVDADMINSAMAYTLKDNKAAGVLKVFFFFFFFFKVQ